MEENKKALLIEQVNKIKEALDVLKQDFADEAVDEINFITIACENLSDLAK